MFRSTCTTDQTLSSVDSAGVVVWIRQQGPMDYSQQVPCLVILANVGDNEKHQHTSSRHVYGFDRVFGG
jgi:hypothetical protein